MNQIPFIIAFGVLVTNPVFADETHQQNTSDCQPSSTKAALDDQRFMNNPAADDCSPDKKDTFSATGTLYNNQMSNLFGAMGGVRHYRRNWQHAGNPPDYAVNVIRARDGEGNLGFWTSPVDQDPWNEMAGLEPAASPGNFMFGMDYLSTNNLVGGVAIGYEDINTNDVYPDKHRRTNGHSIAGYLSYLINDNYSLDFALGHSDLDIDQSRLSLGPFPGSPFAAGTTFSDPVNADRLFFTGNLNGIWLLGRWVVGAHLGYLASSEDPAAFSESSQINSITVVNDEFSLKQIRTGLDLAYAFNHSFEPYVALDYLKDTQQELHLLPSGVVQPAYQDEEYLLSTGMRYFMDNGFSSNLQFNYSTNQEQFDNTSLMFFLRLDML